jgi:hypothetical protein
MRAWFYLLLTIVCCLGLLILDIWPGLSSGIFDSFGAWMFYMCFTPIALFVYLVWRFQTKSPNHSDIPKKKSIWFVIARWGFIAITIFLLREDVPKRIVFSIYRQDFEKMLVNVPNEYRGKEINQQIGPYFVDRYGSRIECGEGVYFRTYDHGDGIGPDTMSHGFVYKPNQKGTPFGRSKYHYGHIEGDWYWFCVSDD